MTCVIKLGGSLLADTEGLAEVCEAVGRLAKSEPVVVVHGGGARISEMSRRLGLVPHFEDGLRVTDGPTLEVALMALGGLVNRTVVAAFARAGVSAVGFCGGDGSLATARPLRPELGHVGEVVSIRTDLLERLLAAGFLPVVAPLALSESGGWLNVNADQMAAAFARALLASRLVFLTDVAGVLAENGTVLPCLALSEARRMIESGTVRGGMRPKLQACDDALTGGVREVVILPGLQAGALASGGTPEAGTRMTL